MKLNEAVDWVMGYLETHPYISMETITKELDVSDKAAWVVAKACFDEGLLMPMDKAYLAQPADGKPAKFQPRSSSTSKRLGAKIQEVIASRPEMGFILREISPLVLGVEAPTKSQMQRVREHLDAMATDGWLVRRSALAGGFYGKPPIIWGLTTEAVDARDGLVIAGVANRKKPGRKTNAIRQAKLEYQALMKTREQRDLTPEELREIVRLNRVIRGDT